ncbi:MAG: hypothetical protein PHN20_08510 [Bacteroidales bacterium]|nr:hypothetical protein [Bacteroidales bacterium]
MRMNAYIKVTLVAILTIISHMVFAQERIVSYQDFELAYSENSDLKIISKKFNLLFILLLDTAYKVPFFEYDEELKDFYIDYSYGLKPNDSTVGFAVHIKEIDELFSSNLFINKVLDCVTYSEDRKSIKQRINYPIYKKDNTAIIEILSGGSSDIYYLKIHNGIVQINWLGGVIE